MDSTDFLRRMVKQSGKTSSQIARELGRSDSYLRATIAQHTRPRIDTFVEIAHACGYEVVLRSERDTFTLGEDADPRAAAK